MNRNSSIDLLRIAGAFAIVIIHAVSSTITYKAIDASAEVSKGFDLVHILMMWAVPVFFIITGYCLGLKKECTYKYCLSHALKYTAILLTIGLFYALLEEVYEVNTVSFLIFLNALKNVYTGNLWAHMWFVYALIGIYLVMPVIALFMREGGARGSLILIGLLFFFDVLCSTFNRLGTIGIDFPFTGYLFYVCFGLYLSKHKIHSKIPYVILGVLSIVWIVFNPSVDTYDYNHLAVCLMAVAAFAIITDLNINPNRVVTKVSGCTLGIYLIHPFFINVAIKLLKINMGADMPYLKVTVFALIVFSASLIATWVFKKIPVIRKLF